MDLTNARLKLAGLIAPSVVADGAHWEGRFVVEKFDSDDLSALGKARCRPFEVVEGKNLLLTSGADAYHQRLIATAVTAFSSTNARIAVGDSTTAAAASQTDLQASTNKLRKLVDATPTISGNTIAFVATFGSTDANWAWNEAAITNAATGGNMLNRVVQSFGTKVSGQTWVCTGTIALT